MKIRVCYSELKSTGDFNNKRAEAEIEMEVHGDVDKAFEKLWSKCKSEVKKQLEETFKHEEIPF
ncbi:MAG: hypothetical protein QXS27_03760 [Candidatus Jordarchaeaceae archaeon]